MTIQLGEGFGPCHLCSKSALYYSHLSARDSRLSAKLRAIEESVADNRCICRVCEKDIKRKNNLEKYVPCWAYTGSIENTPKCILPNCEKTESIVHSLLIKGKHICDTFHVSDNTEGKLVLLCQVHYKQMHRMINPQRYMHGKCFTCNANIKRSYRYCPDTIAIKHHSIQHGDMEMNITERDSIYTNCYNSHLEIIAKSEQNSHDYESRAHLSSVIINQFPGYISHGLKDAILKLGDILLKKVAILLSELYNIVIKQSMTKVSEMNLAYTKGMAKDIAFQDELTPSIDALQLHWLRTLYVADYWSQVRILAS